MGRPTAMTNRIHMSVDRWLTDLGRSRVLGLPLQSPAPISQTIGHRVAVQRDSLTVGLQLLEESGRRITYLD